MFRLRSIRRKLALSLALVMAMLLVQGASGLSAIFSYRHYINEADAQSNSPQRKYIVIALAQVFEPLGWPALKTPDWLVVRQRAVKERLLAVSTAIEDYHRRLDAESPPLELRLPVEQVLQRMNLQLRLLDDEQVPRLGDPETADAAAAEIRRGVADLQLITMQIPRKETTLSIVEARDVYRSRFWWITLSGVTAFVLFLSVIRCMYSWIFVPIRKLHECASRVAQGDFGYRVHLRGHDEMAQLAEKLNSMTARFEEIKDRLDGEVTARSRQLLRSERLAGVGFLAAGVAHEINNPLSAIAMAAESLESRLQEANAVEAALSQDDLAVMRPYLAMIQREAFRCQQITQRLLDFSRAQDASRSPQDLTRIVAEVLDMVGHLSKFRGHQIVFDRSRAVVLTVNGAEIKQVVLNLVANALESMDQTGRLEIGITEYADEVVLTFRDNGCGMTPHVLENLFEPFFTEKKSGRGTGLGLSITHRIVSDHGGRIEAASAGPGQGSTFRVHLPRAVVQTKAA